MDSTSGPSREIPKGHSTRQPGASAVWRWLALLIPLITILQREAEFVRWRLFLPVLAVTSAFALWRARAGFRSIRSVVLAGCLFAVSLLVTAMPYFTPSRWSASRVAVVCAPVIAAWAFFLFIYRDRARSENEAPGNENRRPDVRAKAWQVTGLVAGTFVLLAVAHWLTQADYVTFYDELLYVLQSRLMREPGFVRHIDESLSPFFALRQSVFSEGRLYTQYPPGHPLILAVFDVAGLRWWTGVVLSTVAVVFTYLLGRDLYSGFAGRAAAALVAVNQLFVMYGASYMPHGPTLAMATAAAWLLIRTEGRSAWHRPLGWCAAGLLLGSVVAIRPLTGAAITVSIVLWQLLRRRHPWSELARLTGFMAIGSALPILALLYYNDVTNGAPLLFGYTAVHGSLHDLGFGQRGYVVPDTLGRWVTESRDFTVVRAISHQILIMSDLARVALPAFLLVPLLWIGYRHGYAVRWATVLAFLVLPVLHFFYFYAHTRFYLELFPFLFVGVAGMLTHIRRQDRSLANGLLLSVLAVELMLTGIDIRRRAAERLQTSSHAAMVAVREAHDARGKLLVFVEDDDQFLSWVSWFNIDEFPGDVIVARDLGNDNLRLTRRFPEHLPMRIARSGGTVRLSELE